jgi:hypothetical protein
MDLPGTVYGSVQEAARLLNMCTQHRSRAAANAATHFACRAQARPLKERMQVQKFCPAGRRAAHCTFCMASTPVIQLPTLVSFLAASTILSTLASDRPLTACRRCRHIHPQHISSRSAQRSSRSQFDSPLTACRRCKQIHPQHSSSSSAQQQKPIGQTLGSMQALQAYTPAQQQQVSTAEEANLTKP